MLIPEKITSFIKDKVKDQSVSFVLQNKFASTQENYRNNIRRYIAAHYPTHFSTLQLALLTDLNTLPECKSNEGYFSISHNLQVGGFTFSKHPHGFDAEEIKRISIPIIERTSSEAERKSVPNITFLWVAKEAAYKALNRNLPALTKPLIMTDLICSEWQSHSESSVHSFRVMLEKPLAETLSLNLNLGFVFSDKDILFSIYFK